MNRKKNNWTIAFIFTIMILIALSDNVRGVFIPTLKSDFATNNAQMGIMLSACSLGYIISTYIGGIFCEKIGQKKVMVSGFIFAILSLIGVYTSKTFFMLLIGLFFLNVGVSLLAIGINTLIPVLAVGYQAVLMNLIHFSYGAGATITQRSAGVLLYRGISWRNIYLMIAVLFVVVFLGFLFVKIPEPKRAREEQEIRNKEIFNNKLLYFYMLALGLYVAAEMGTQSWFINFLKEVYKFNDNKSTYYSALFFGIFTVGRLLGGFVVERFGHLKSVLISLLISFGLFTTGLIMGENGVTIITLSGLFFGINFPTIVLTISKVFTKNSAYVTGIIITVASSINMIMNIIIGWFNDIFGVYTAFYIIPISLLVSAIFTCLIYINNKGSLKNSRN